MRIDEITSKKSSEDEQLLSAFENSYTDHEIAQSLNKLGWTLLAYGNFGKVFAKMKKPYVIKITRTEDFGYEKFVSIVHDHPNIHFPKITKDIIVNDFYIYFIEKLQPFTNIHLKAEMHEYISMLNLKYIHNGYGEQKTKIQQFEKAHPTLAVALDTLYNYIDEDESSNLMVDLDNPSNIMKRGDGTPVIIDPFIDRSTIDAEDDFGEEEEEEEE